MSDSPSEDTAKRPRHRSWDHWKGEFYSKAKDAIRSNPSDIFIYLKLRERRSSEVHLQPAITPTSSIHPIRPTSVIHRYKGPHINLEVLLICLFSTFSLRTPHLLEQPKTHMNLLDRCGLSTNYPKKTLSNLHLSEKQDPAANSSFKFETVAQVSDCLTLSWDKPQSGFQLHQLLSFMSWKRA